VISIAISGTGLYTPPESISNTELVQAYNEYVRRYNAAHHEAIAADAMPPLLKSSDEFIFKASGIRRRHVLSREGMLDPEVMCPRLPERPNEEISVSAEISIAAARQALEAAHRTAADIDGVIVAANCD
jgi:beta-ketodecanoyl-[acyl-carrier-protein] synthase